MANNDRNRYNQDWDQNRRSNDWSSDYNSHYDRYRNRREDYQAGDNYGNASYGYSNDRRDDYDSSYRNRDWDRNGSDFENDQKTSGGWNREDYDGRWLNSGSNYNRERRRDYEDRDWNNRNVWDRSKDEVSSWFGNENAERRREEDKGMMGVHRGKGPRGYTRSDDRIREDVHDRLADDPYVDASDIEVKVENGNVILTGNVHGRDQKRRAEDIIDDVSGVRDVENRLHVVRNERRYQDGNRNNDEYTGYTGTTDDMSGIGRESGTTNEIIRNSGNMNQKR